VRFGYYLCDIRRARVFGNRALRGIFGSKRDEVIGETQS
jgi:PAS domain-containing protein